MKKRILVVDDDRDMLALLQDLLESEAYEVDTAHDGLIALEKLVHRREQYEVILLDLTMPGMNGLQLIQVLQQQEATCLRNIIVVSGNQDAMQEVIWLGIRSCLAKPFDLETLLELVSSCSVCPSEESSV
jgi:two-component system, sensor histidine kinase and response regulator